MCLSNDQNLRLRFVWRNERLMAALAVLIGTSVFSVIYTRASSAWQAINATISRRLTRMNTSFRLLQYTSELLQFSLRENHLSLVFFSSRRTRDATLIMIRYRETRSSPRWKMNVRDVRTDCVCVLSGGLETWRNGMIDKWKEVDIFICHQLLK